MRRLEDGLVLRADRGAPQARRGRACRFLRPPCCIRIGLRARTRLQARRRSCRRQRARRRTDVLWEKARPGSRRRDGSDGAHRMRAAPDGRDETARALGRRVVARCGGRLSGPPQGRRARGDLTQGGARVRLRGSVDGAQSLHRKANGGVARTRGAVLLPLSARSRADRA